MPNNQELQYLRSFCDDEMFALPRHLPQKYLRNCVMLEKREEILRRLPRGGVAAEIGTARGDFAKSIVDIVAPEQFHIFDVSFAKFDHLYFQQRIDQGSVTLHHGDSSTMLSALQDNSLDWIYIDGDHSFEGVNRDIAQAVKKIKHKGYVLFNDYTIYSPFEKIQYGVQRAVNDLCLGGGFEIFMFALSVVGYHDVALRRIAGEEQ